MAKLTTIEGVGDALSAKLKAAGAGTVEKLLQAGSDRQGRAQLAAASGVDAQRILRFVNHADLMRIRGVGGEMSELLEAAGVDTVPELANRNAANLHKKMIETNDAKKLVRRPPTADQVQGWIEQARALPRVVQY